MVVWICCLEGSLGGLELSLRGAYCPGSILFSVPNSRRKTSRKDSEPQRIPWQDVWKILAALRLCSPIFGKADHERSIGFRLGGKI